jgi:hypothetical protein
LAREFEQRRITGFVVSQRKVMRIISTSVMRGTPTFGHERSIHLLLILKVRQPRTGRFAVQVSIFEPTPQHEASVAWFTNKYQIVQPRPNVKAKV